MAAEASPHQRLALQTQSLVEAHWRFANARDWAAFGALLHPALRYEVPQTREYIDTGEGYLALFRTWPGAWSAHVVELVCEAGKAICVIDFEVDGRTETGIAIVEQRDGLICKVTDYWPAPYEPPARATPHFRRRPA